MDIDIEYSTQETGDRMTRVSGKQGIRMKDNRISGNQD
jgi:hypothetical protein